MTAGLLFDEARHAYTLDGSPVPGVSTILKAVSTGAYAGVDPEVMARAAALGTAVHKVIELDVRGVLDEDTLDPQLVPYLVQWRQFLQQSGFQPLVSEHRVASRRYGFAGTLDLFGILNGRKALIDAKRVAQVMPATGPQTAGYETALREWSTELVGFDDPVDRYALQLVPSGTWRLHPLKDRTDARTFLAALTVHNFNARNYK